MNKGYQYEVDLSQKYSAFNSSHSGQGNGMDLNFTLGNRPINVEVKYTNTPSSAKNINYGQSAFRQLPNGKWDFTPSNDAGAIERRDLLRSIGILDYINEKWSQKTSIIKEELKKANSRKQREDAAKKERRMLGQLPRIGLIENKAALKYNAKKIDMISEEDFALSNLYQLKNAVQSYYSKKGADYVQIRNFGLYRLSGRDPIAELSGGQVQIPLFDAANVLVRIRLKATGAEKLGTRGYTWFAALEAYGFPSTQIRVLETRGSENRRTPYKFGRFFKSDLDDVEFKKYLTFLNQSL
ncbi:MAG TPA: hypothetical protein DF712_12925 [Balneola sp.]|nr:hypothetical protein [Balneola sp.]|tara:strand:+ start:1074 stop:1964 length:891 start_codon:yes stop_codon:yes gene_type:complete